MTERQEEIIDEINCFTYEQYDSVWCKTELIKNLENYSYDKSIINVFFKDPNSIKYQKDIIKIYIDDNLTYVTPESFCYRHSLLEADWKLSENKAHIEIIDVIIENSFFYIQKQIKDAENERKEWLSHWGLNNISEYENASKEIKDEINLPKFYENFGFTPKGGPWLDFTEYNLLKRYFLEELFCQDHVNFFVNMSPDEVQVILESKRNIPAVIGIDSEKIGLFWYNY